MAVALRRAALPRSLPATPALEVRHGFDPPGADGRWYDVIPLLGGTGAGRLETSPQELRPGSTTSTPTLRPPHRTTGSPAPAPACTSSTTRSWPTSPSRAPVHCPPVAAAPGATSQVLHGMHGPGLGRPHEKYYETRLPAEPGTVLGLVALSSPGAVLAADRRRPVSADVRLACSLWREADRSGAFGPHASSGRRAPPRRRPVAVRPG